MREKIPQLYSIHIFRIVCAFAVFLFHSHIHVDVSYGVFNNFISQCHIFMVAFFMLSGFSLYYVDEERCRNMQITYMGGVKNFMFKRLVSVFPLYIAVWILYAVWLFLKGQLIPAWKHMVIAPVELAMLQSVYDGSFGVLHNGGTWFISCIFICYLVYPYLRQVVHGNGLKSNIVLLAFCYCVSSYAFLPVYVFEFQDIYANPFFRICEFLCGMLFAYFFENRKERQCRVYKILVVPLLLMMLVLGITVGVHFGIRIVSAYNFVAVPIFGFTLYFCARIEWTHKITRFRKLISVLSENSYAFFLSQFFCFDILKWLMNRTPFFSANGNMKKFFVSLSVACVMTAVLHYGIENPAKAAMNKFKNNNRLGEKI